jgi:hypothetical protein
MIMFENSTTIKLGRSNVVEELLAFGRIRIEKGQPMVKLE